MISLFVKKVYSRLVLIFGINSCVIIHITVTYRYGVQSSSYVVLLVGRSLFFLHGLKLVKRLRVL